MDSPAPFPPMFRMSSQQRTSGAARSPEDLSPTFGLPPSEGNPWPSSRHRLSSEQELVLFSPGGLNKTLRWGGGGFIGHRPSTLACSSSFWHCCPKQESLSCSQDEQTPFAKRLVMTATELEASGRIDSFLSCSMCHCIQLVTALHGFTPDQTGLFLSIRLGALVGQMINPLQEKLYLRQFPTKAPEARLYRACVGALLVPIGCFVCGWTSFSSASIAGPLVGIVMTTTGIDHIYLRVLNSLVDSYLVYTSSALAGQSLLHELLGSVCPLFVEAMYRRLTYPWASSLAGFIGFLFSLIPFVLILNSPRIRARSRLSQKVQREGERERT
ncbi:hypothetical protein K437DRAFT_77932 [Tilletiaria anomala UBC 951]|uniref:Uncharacterized protein n=1 Tax=Tilletiaria anomala (strain ATCC 24038 / CBS 436.72 / UBC 951) TaxID=1037660 RepID=A0A066VA74_TILAU|nr:uncharacterized protein K437DRAFT_77932 [Tilletiaria anomala UBC 951]KDN35485.1 hypothetical protein K437DRAFT_77932 [Tilletiaria anomala UBC 951]